MKSISHGAPQGQGG